MTYKLTQGHSCGTSSWWEFLPLWLLPLTRWPSWQTEMSCRLIQTLKKTLDTVDFAEHGLFKTNSTLIRSCFVQSILVGACLVFSVDNRSLPSPLNYLYLNYLPWGQPIQYTHIYNIFINLIILFELLSLGIYRICWDQKLLPTWGRMLLLIKP